MYDGGIDSSSCAMELSGVLNVIAEGVEGGKASGVMTRYSKTRMAMRRGGIACIFACSTRRLSKVVERIAYLQLSQHGKEGVLHWAVHTTCDDAGERNQRVQ